MTDKSTSSTSTSFSDDSECNFLSTISTTTTVSSADQKESFSSLPNRVLLNIFKHFSEEELLTKIAPVCRHWKNSAMDHKLWTKIQTKGDRLPANAICRRIWRFPKITELQLNNVPKTNEIVKGTARCLKHLQYLTLRNCTLQEQSLRHLLVLSPFLKSIDIKGSTLKANNFFVEIGGAKLLTSINLGGNPYLTTQNILSVIFNCHNLEHLHISIFKQGLLDYDCIIIGKMIGLKLKSLSLDVATVSNEAIMKMLAQCPILENLHLNCAYNLTGNSFKNLWTYFNKLVLLKIRLAQSVAGSDFVELFRNGKHVLEQLEAIDFSYCTQLNDDGVKEIVQTCPGLKKIILRNCKNITNISTIIETCPDLEEINFAFCKCSNFHVPEKNSLQRIFLSEDNLVNKIKMICPNSALKKCLSLYNKNVENY